MSRTPINPPAPQLRIPANSLVEVSQHSVQGSHWRRHRTRRPLEPGSPYCYHGPDLLVFRLKDWLLRIHSASVVQRLDRVITALQFDIESSAETQLIVWPDIYGNAEFTRPKRLRGYHA